MHDWYRYYRAEANRRGDEIKAAEKHRLIESARIDPYAPPVPKIHQRLFRTLASWLTHRTAPKKDQAPVPRVPRKAI